MSKRKDICTALRLPMSYPNTYITNAKDGSILINHWYAQDNGVCLAISRRDARLLAKRINSHLDYSNKK